MSADNVTRTVDAGMDLVAHGFEAGLEAMAGAVERALAMPLVGPGLLLRSDRGELLAGLKQSILDEFRKDLAANRSRVIAETDQKAAAL